MKDSKLKTIMYNRLCLYQKIENSFWQRVKMGKEVDKKKFISTGRNLRLRQGRCGTIEDNFDRLVSEFDFHSRSETEDNFDKSDKPEYLKCYVASLFA